MQPYSSRSSHFSTSYIKYFKLIKIFIKFLKLRFVLSRFTFTSGRQWAAPPLLSHSRMLRQSAVLCPLRPISSSSLASFRSWPIGRSPLSPWALSLLHGQSAPLMVRSGAWPSVTALGYYCQIQRWFYTLFTIFSPELNYFLLK